jgi:hypothetical protein
MERGRSIPVFSPSGLGAAAPEALPLLSSSTPFDAAPSPGGAAWDRSKSPKTVVAKTADGKAAFQGIYNVEKDSLSLCLSVKATPKEFKDSPPQSRLFEFKRVEKK